MSQEKSRFDTYTSSGSLKDEERYDHSDDQKFHDIFQILESVDKNPYIVVEPGDRYTVYHHSKDKKIDLKIYKVLRFISPVTNPPEVEQDQYQNLVNYFLEQYIEAAENLAQQMTWRAETLYCSHHDFKYQDIRDVIMAILSDAYIDVLISSKGQMYFALRYKDEIVNYRPTKKGKKASAKRFLIGDILLPAGSKGEEAGRHVPYIPYEKSTQPPREIRDTRNLELYTKSTPGRLKFEMDERDALELSRESVRAKQWLREASLRIKRSFEIAQKATTASTIEDKPTPVRHGNHTPLPTHKMERTNYRPSIRGKKIHPATQCLS